MGPRQFGAIGVGVLQHDEVIRIARQPDRRQRLARRGKGAAHDAVDVRRAGVPHPLRRLAELDDALALPLVLREMQVGQLGDGVTMDIVDAAGNVAGLDVGDDHAHLHRAHRRGERLAAIAEQQQDVGPQLLENRREALDAAPERLRAIERRIAVAAQVHHLGNRNLRPHLLDGRAECRARDACRRR